MNTIRTQIGVKACTACPFFERTMFSLLADVALKRGSKSGACRFNGIGQAFPSGRMHIADETTTPAGCPLDAGDVLITLERK